MRRRSLGAVAVAIVAAFVIAACGSSSNSSSAPAPSAARAPRASGSSGSSGASGTINGAGSTFAAPIYQQWGSTLKGQGLTVNFNAVGSGAGIAQLQSATVDFAGSDPARSPSEVSQGEGPRPPVPDRVRRGHGLLQPVGRQERDQVRRHDARRHLPRQDQDLGRPGDQVAEPGPEPAEHEDHRRAPLGLIGHNQGFHHVPVGLQPGVDGGRRQARQDRQVADRNRRQGELRRRRGGQADRRAPSATSSRPTRCRTDSRTPR